MLAFLNRGSQADHGPSARSAAQNVVQNRSCNPTVVFIGYLTMYLIRKNFNIAQNDMISTYGLSMTQLGMIGPGFSITYGVGKTLVSYATAKHQTIPAVHADPVCHLYAGLQCQYGQRLG